VTASGSLIGTDASVAAGYGVNFSGAVFATAALHIGANGIMGTERTDPSAPAANSGIVYFRDTGGKTELVVRFPTGAVQQLAIEP
jgi:hypothetical protein